MYAYSDCQKIGSNEEKDLNSKNVNFFCSKNMNNTISILTYSLNKKNEFLTKLKEKEQFDIPKNEGKKLSKSKSDLFSFQKYDHYCNWVQNIRVSILPQESKIPEAPKKKFFHEIYAEKTKEMGTNPHNNQKIETTFVPNITTSKINGIDLALKEEGRLSEEKSKLINSNKKQKQLSEQKFWEFDNTTKDKETRVIIRKIFDKKLIYQLKLDNRSSKEMIKDYKKDEFKNNEKLIYVNDKIGKIKRKILFMKGVFDFAYPKMMIQKLKVNVQPKVEVRNKKDIIDIRGKLVNSPSRSQGLKIVNLSSKSDNMIQKQKENNSSSNGFDYYTKITKNRRTFYKNSREVNSMPKINVISPFQINLVQANQII